MRAFEFTGVHTIIAQCADMTRSTVFYRDILGLTATMLNPYWTTFSLGSNVLALHPPFGPEAMTQGGWTLAMSVDSVKGLREALMSHGVVLTQDFHEIPGGVLIGFSDPDGNLIQAIQSGAKLSDLE